MRGGKGEQKSNTRIATFVYRIDIGLQYFSRNLSGKCCNIFYFLQNFVRPADLRGPPRGLGGLAPARIGSKASWQIALGPHWCAYTWVVVSRVVNFFYELTCRYNDI
jgi:hypothetical protein